MSATQQHPAQRTVARQRYRGGVPALQARERARPSGGGNNDRAKQRESAGPRGGTGSGSGSSSTRELALAGPCNAGKELTTRSSKRSSSPAMFCVAVLCRGRHGGERYSYSIVSTSISTESVNHLFFVVSVGSLLKSGLRPARRTHACRGIGRTSPDSVSFSLRGLEIYMDYT